MDAVALTLRPADADDFDEIVKLSEGIYAGHDYLPLIFHQWLQRDNIVVILAHCGVRLFGLEAYFVVDDGRTLINRAGRVHPDYRGQGIFKQVGEYTIKHAKEHYANLQRKRSISIGDTTGGPSSSCEMIILRNNSHGGIIRVCMGIFTTALRNKKIRQILNKNTSPYFHSVSLVI